jgi:twitching motility protein PilT
MRFDDLVHAAVEARASDLHLEAGLPPCLRVRGVLRSAGDPVDPRALLAMAREVVGDALWPAFLERRSADVARTVAGVRCRVNVLTTARGVGMAVRLLPSPQVSLERLNLHPDLARLVAGRHGLVVVSGPTGCGKTSTLAALVHELNVRESRHVVTLESPIEYAIPPRRCFVRQREVGRDTPSFAQGLFDALREDPDVLVVGELRDPESMRLTLNAAETGHLVLTTLHSATTAEALQRLVSAFPPEIQAGVCAQLADCLVGVVAQRLRWFPDRGVQAPECEVLVASQNVRALVRQGQFFKLQSALETGAADGSWTFARYRDWLDRRTDWHVPSVEEADRDRGTPPAPELPPQPLPDVRAPRTTPARAAERAAAPPRAAERPPPPLRGTASADGVLEIDAPEEDLDRLLAELDRSR